MNKSRLQEYILLPTRGIQAHPATSTNKLAEFLRSIDPVRTVAASKKFASAAGIKDHQPSFRVIDSIHEDGAKLLEMTPEVANAFKAAQPGARLVPVVWFMPMRHAMRIESRVKVAATALKTTVTVSSKGSGVPVAGANVVAFTDFENRIGASGTTNKKGLVTLSLGPSKRIQRLYVYGPVGYWGAFKRNVATGAVQVRIEPVDLAYNDCVRHFYGDGAPQDGQGVTVAVVDTGVGPHPDLVVDGGVNTVIGESPGEFGDNGDMHGTHVAGIIAARGAPPEGIRRIAPGVRLRSYRVFGQGADGASNYAIAKAIDRAVADGCDLINLSLGGADRDAATSSAIHDARMKGSVVLAATGNDDRSPVSFPAADPHCIAVSAMGRKGTFPKGSGEQADVMGPYGTDKRDFIAAFSNVGGEVDLTGPGVGVLSTVPGGHMPMSGTSMACPAVTGIAARLLAKKPQILAMPRDQARSDAIAHLVLTSAASLGFPSDLEGSGLPR